MQPLQISYALNATTNGPAGQTLATFANGSTNVMIVWEHSALPACAFLSGDVDIPWPFNRYDSATHYPPRHAGSFNVLYCDGHVDAMLRTELQTSLFAAK